MRVWWASGLEMTIVAVIEEAVTHGPGSSLAHLVSKRMESRFEIYQNMRNYCSDPFAFACRLYIGAFSAFA